MITYKIAPRKDFTKKNGLSPLCLTLTIDSKKKRISLKHYVQIDLWDFKNSLVKPSFNESESLNLLLKSYKKRTEDIIYHYELHHKDLTFDSFIKEFKKPKSESFYSFIKSELASYTDRL